MELRDIEIFLTLAEELHFGRTAELLHITAARVSQSVRAQERRIGGVLFERTTRTVRLTPLGKQLQRDLSEAHRQLTEAVRNAALTAGSAAALSDARGLTGTVRLGIMGAVGHEISDVVDLFIERFPGCGVAQREIHVTEPFAELRAGEVDLALLWRPVEEPDMVVGPTLLAEERVLAMWPGHELADRPSVSLADFGGRVFVDTGPEVPSRWMEAMLPAAAPDGTPVLRGPRVKTFHEVMHAVATRQALSPLTEHYARYYSHPGIVLIPVVDAPLIEWALVWRSSDLSPQARAFAEIATARGERRFGHS